MKQALVTIDFYTIYYTDCTLDYKILSKKIYSKSLEMC